MMMLKRGITYIRLRISVKLAPLARQELEHFRPGLLKMISITTDAAL